MDEKTLWKILSGLLAIVLSLVVYIYINGVSSQREDINEAKSIAMSASSALIANTTSIVELRGRYDLLQAKLDYIIDALRTNGIRGNLPIPTSENIDNIEISKQ